jgi:putative phosphoribosyl transferase
MDLHELHRQASMLAGELSSLVHAPVVLGIPRGGMLLADTIARTLRAPLDILVAGRVETPGETAIAAIAEGGVLVVDEHAVRRLELPRERVEVLIEHERERQAGLLARIRGTWPLPALAHRSVVLVDDAMISGLTMRAAIVSARRRGAWRVIVAAPLCATEALAKVSAQVVRIAMLPEDAARRIHDIEEWEPCPPLGDAEIHDLIAQEHHDVGVDPFGSLALDAT